MQKRGILDCDPPRKPDSEDLWTQSSFGTWFVRGILEMRAKDMHGSVCPAGTKYYLAVRRSCSWSGQRLQCLWTHIVQITNPIRKRIAIQNGFRNVIHSFVNRPIHSPWAETGGTTLIPVSFPIRCFAWWIIQQAREQGFESTATVQNFTYNTCLWRCMHLVDRNYLHVGTIYYVASLLHPAIFK